MTHIDMNAMFGDYLSHMAPEEARSTIAQSDWSYVDRYIRWFFRVSLSYMVQASLGDPPRSAYQEIPEEEHVRLNHGHDMLHRYHRIVEIAHASIGKCIFLMVLR